MAESSVEYIDHQELLARAKANRPTKPENTVSSFSSWVFGLYMRSSRVSMQQGKEVELDIEKRVRQRQSPPLTTGYELLFADPLDRSHPSLKISSLTLNGQPLYGIPDIVYGHTESGRVVIMERKTTTSQPKEWPNLKVQLWCYGQIDRWKSAKRVDLRGMVYDPHSKYDVPLPKPVGNWHRDDKKFDAECRELFKLFGGRATS